MSQAICDASTHRTVAICICTRDRPLELAQTLASIAKSKTPASRIVISDDGRDRRTQEVSREAGALYVRGPRRGLGANRNHALAQTSEDLVLFLDDDCLLSPSFLDQATACMAVGEDGYGRSRTIVTGSELNRGTVVRASAQTFLGFQARPYRPGEPMTSIVINSTLFPRTLFSSLKFDEKIRYGYDEVDLASRAVASGYRIVECLAASNEHRPSPRSREGYGSFTNASRLYVTLRRYAITERRPGTALAFALVAPVHALAAGLRSRGPRGGVQGLRAVYLGYRYFTLQLLSRGR